MNEIASTEYILLWAKLSNFYPLKAILDVENLCLRFPLKSLDERYILRKMIYTQPKLDSFRF